MAEKHIPKWIIRAFLKVISWSTLIVISAFWHYRYNVAQSVLPLAVHFSLWCCGLFIIIFSTKYRIDFQKKWKKRENEIIELKRFNENIVKSISDGIIIEDENGIIRFANPAMHFMLGYNGNELFGLHWQEIVSPDDIKGVNEANTRRKMGFSDQYEIKLKKKDNEELAVLVSGVPSFYSKKYSGMLATFIDISKMKKAEHKLAESANTFNTIFENTPSILVLVNEEGRVENINHNGVAFSGKSKEKILGLLGGEVFNCLTSFEGDGCGKNKTCLSCPVRTRVEKTLSSKEQILNEEGRMSFMKDDEVLNLDLLISTIPVSILGRELVLLSITDITLQKRIEKALMQSEERFKALHNASFGGITIHDKGKILECNNGLSEITGYSHEELIGMDVLLLIAEQSREWVRNKIAVGYEKPYYGYGVRKDGEEFPLRLEARNIPYKGKEARVVEFRDITEQRKLEEQLHQAQKMESIGHLAGGIAHDFNNLLTPIISGTELLMFDSEEGERHYEELHVIHDTALRAADLTRQLLAFSRKQILEMKPVNINNLIEKFRMILRRTIREDVQIDVTYGVIESKILVDISQIEQVLMNLSINAQDAMPDGGKLHIKTSEERLELQFINEEQGLQSGDFNVIEISDTGTGIDSTIRNKVFDPFFTTKAVGKGTGLGLSTVYGIVNQHSGFVDIINNNGCGTNFKIYLPIHDEGKNTYAPEVENIRKGNIKDAEGTVLIVEDQPQVRLVASKILEKAGYTVYSYDKGSEAINDVIEKKLRPDLLLTDVIMPEMNGQVLNQEIRKLFPEIQVLFMSGYTADIIGQHGVLDNGVHFIQKPLTYKNLTEKVNSVMLPKRAV